MRVTRHLDQAAAQAQGTAASAPRVAVVLLHIGGPADATAIEPFHRRLWEHDEIAPRGLLARQGTQADAAWQQHGERLVNGYRILGGGSPLPGFAAAQALALENRLHGRPVMAPSTPGPFRVRCGFAFSSPSIADAVADACASGAACVIGIPLYPHASAALSGVCGAAFNDAVRQSGIRERSTLVGAYHDHALLQDALAARTRRTYELVPPKFREDAFLILNAHSPPYARAHSGDYLAQVEATAQHVMAALGFDEGRSAVAWTSFRAPVRELSPAVAALCEERGKAGVKALIVSPISYVTDAFETLHDLDVEAYQAALSHGVVQFRRVPVLNADPAFIELLAGLVLAALPPDLGALARGAACRS